MLFPHWPSSSHGQAVPKCLGRENDDESDNRSSFLAVQPERLPFRRTGDVVGEEFSDCYVTFTVSSLLFGFLSCPSNVICP